MACGVDNNQAKLAIKAGSGTVDFSSGATRLEMNPGETMNSTNTILRGEGIRGTRGKSVLNTRLGPFTHAGAIPFDLSIALLKIWGEYALGDETSNVLTPTESLPIFGIVMDKVSDACKWEDCKVGALTLTGSGGIIKGSVDIAARAWSDSSVTFPSIDLSGDAIDTPLVLSDGALVIGGTTYEFGSFELGINNGLQTIVRNALNPGCLREGERSVTLKANIPSTSAAWTALKAPSLAGVAATLTLTSTLAAVSATISLPVCQKSHSIPLVSNKSEQTFDIAFDCVTNSSNASEITITLDTTA